MSTYNWQHSQWPNFSYSLENAEDKLFLFANKIGHVTGILKGLPENAKMETIVDMMVAEAIKTSEIEGEYLSRKDVMSSIKNNLGFNEIPEPIKDKKAGGIGKLMADVRKTYKESLTEKRLFAWHKMLLPDSKRINTGVWRTHSAPMQVVSGAVWNPKVHYEAPPSERVPAEMERFIEWFNDTSPGGKKDLKNPPVRSAIAHLYFETIHPFEDGNGRIGRAIAEKALSQGIGRPILLSLSKTIEANRKSYYNALGGAQQSNEITSWINYFVDIILKAQTAAEEQIDFTLKKVKFFEKFRGLMNERQLKVVRKMLEQGPADFQGGMNAKKYISLTRTSKATATRDLQDLVEKGAFILFGEGGGRSTSYQVNL